jgi:hypothetical protein
MLSTKSLVFSKKNCIGGFKLNSILVEKDIIPISIKTQKGGSLFNKTEEMIIPLGLLTDDSIIEGFQSIATPSNLVIEDSLFNKIQNI